MARPKVVLDKEQIKKLAAIQCTNVEIATVLGVNVRTIERRFAAAIKEGRQHGTSSLRRKQYEVAMTGNVGMLIWLGKQYLGQTDKREIDTTSIITIDHKEKIEEYKAKILELVPLVRAEENEL